MLCELESWNSKSYGDTWKKLLSTPPVRYSISSDLLFAHLFAVTTFPSCLKQLLKDRCCGWCSRMNFHLTQIQFNCCPTTIQGNNPSQIWRTRLLLPEVWKRNTGVECVSLEEYKSNNMGKTQHLHRCYCQLCTKQGQFSPRTRGCMKM